MFKLAFQASEWRELVQNTQHNLLVSSLGLPGEKKKKVIWESNWVKVHKLQSLYKVSVAENVEGCLL